MARLQSSPLLRRNHGNASNTDPDAAAPYPEFPLLLPSADTQLYTVGPKKKRVQKNLSKEDKQNVTVSRVQLSCQNYWPALKVPTQVADGWHWGWLTCFYFRSCICTNSSKDNPTTNLCVFRHLLWKNESPVDNTQGLTWCCCKPLVPSTKEFFNLVQHLIFIFFVV